MDDGSRGGAQETVERLIGNEIADKDGNLSYTGTVSQIFALGGFSIKVMVRNGETRPHIINKLRGGVLGLAWNPTSDLKKDNVRLGSMINLETLDQLTNMPLTKWIGISLINAIYDPLCLLAPLTI